MQPNSFPKSRPGASSSEPREFAAAYDRRQTEMPGRKPVIGHKPAPRGAEKDGD